MAQELAAGYCDRCCPTREPKALPDALKGGTAYAVACAARNNTSRPQGSPAGFRTMHYARAGWPQRASRRPGRDSGGLRVGAGGMA